MAMTIVGEHFKGVEQGGPEASLLRIRLYQGGHHGKVSHLHNIRMTNERIQALGYGQYTSEIPSKYTIFIK